MTMSCYPRSGVKSDKMDIGMRFKLIGIDIVWVSYILIKEVAKLFSLFDQKRGPKKVPLETRATALYIEKQQTSEFQPRAMKPKDVLLLWPNVVCTLTCRAEQWLQ